MKQIDVVDDYDLNRALLKLQKRDELNAVH